MGSPTKTGSCELGAVGSHNGLVSSFLKFQFSHLQNGVNLSCSLTRFLQGSNEMKQVKSLMNHSVLCTPEVVPAFGLLIHEREVNLLV